MSRNQCFVSGSASGNALMEYVVPACVILITAGVLVTVTDTNKLMAEYFLSASGHTKNSLKGDTFESKGLATNAYGSLGNGLGGFTSFATLDGGGGGGSSFFYSGAVTRSGSRASAPSDEALFAPSP